MLKVKPELVEVARLVHDGYRADGSADQVITREDVDRAIAAQAKAPKDAKPFNDKQNTQLIALRSWAFKAPDKKLILAR